MIKRRITFVSSAVLSTLVVGTSAQATPARRLQVEQTGDFLLIGNTIGFDCHGQPPPIKVGSITADSCAASAEDYGPDLFWRADAPSAGAATADKAYLPSDARTTAVLKVPGGAEVTHAYLYWAAKSPGSTDRTKVTIERPATGGFQQVAIAIKTHTANAGAYESVADVTDLVRQYRDGAYRVSGIAATPFADVNDSTIFGAWAMVVFYKDPTASLRNLALFDGMDTVSIGANQTFTLDGFQTPTSGYEGKLGVVAYAGDAGYPGTDRLFFATPLTDPQQALGDAANPKDNFFNSTRSWLGTPVSVDGDLPQLQGTPYSMAGVDLDVVDITPKLSGGLTSAPITATSDGDQYYLGAFITSITIFRPDLTTSTKTLRDVNGGNLLSGDVVEYTLNIRNSGNDAAVRSIIRDTLPTGLSFVPNSIAVVADPSTSAPPVPKTDLLGDDEAEYVESSRSLVVRIGAGATATAGGRVAAGATTLVTFQAKVNPGFVGEISNQAVITAGGERGAPDTPTVTDGNGTTAGAPPTVVFVNQCDTNVNCAGSTPACDVSANPRVCVGCVVDLDCGGVASGKVCLADHSCVDGCRGTGGNGCSTGNVCTSTSVTVGSCVQCQLDSDCGGFQSGKICNPTTNTCLDGCRGMGGNGCPTVNVCTSFTSAPGVCVECLGDADCGTAGSGKVCDLATNQCRVGCRGIGGNGCPASEVCSSSDASLGMCVACVTDSHCGTALSGRICDFTTHACLDGCRGQGGNGCPTTTVCTSLDLTAGVCVQCTSDANCGNALSGKVCDAATYTCRDGCRGVGGNGCPSDVLCSSVDNTIGMCVSNVAAAGAAGAAGSGNVAGGGAGDWAGQAGMNPGGVGGRSEQRSVNWDEVVAQGDGCTCSMPGPARTHASWLAAAAAALIAAGRRQSRRAKKHSA
jgi:uncharacterized repeat protein (TIGR01451 family)